MHGDRSGLIDHPFLLDPFNGRFEGGLVIGVIKLCIGTPFLGSFFGIVEDFIDTAEEHIDDLPHKLLFTIRRNAKEVIFE